MSLIRNHVYLYLKGFNEEISGRGYLQRIANPFLEPNSNSKGTWPVSKEVNYLYGHDITTHLHAFIIPADVWRGIQAAAADVLMLSSRWQNQQQWQTDVRSAVQAIDDAETRQALLGSFAEVAETVEPAVSLRASRIDEGTGSASLLLTTYLLLKDADKRSREARKARKQLRYAFGAPASLEVHAVFPDVKQPSGQLHLILKKIKAFSELAETNPTMYDTLLSALSQNVFGDRANQVYAGYEWLEDSGKELFAAEVDRTYQQYATLELPEASCSSSCSIE